MDAWCAGDEDIMSGVCGVEVWGGVLGYVVRCCCHVGRVVPADSLVTVVVDIGGGEDASQGSVTQMFTDYNEFYLR